MRERAPLVGGRQELSDVAHSSSHSVGCFGTVLPLTERARHALGVARNHAADMGADYVDTGHVFLGVLAEPEGIAAVALSDLGFQPEEVAERLRTLEGVCEDRAEGASAFSRPTKMAIECGLQEARVLGCSHADTHHVVLGLLRAAHTYSGVKCAFGSAVGFEDRLRIRNEILRLAPRPPRRA